MALNSHPSPGRIESFQAPDGAERHPPRGTVTEAVLAVRIKAEFREMPGLSPTLTQAARLFGVGPDECARVLLELERDQFLEHLPDGRYRVIDCR